MRNTSCVIVSVALLGACQVETLNESAVWQETNVDKTVWVTMGSDAIESVQEAFFARGLDSGLSIFESTRDVAMVRVTADHLPVLSQIMHDEYHRCAGFIVQPSREAALRSLERGVAADTTEAQLVDYTIDNGAVAQDLIAAVEEGSIADTIVGLSSFVSRYYASQTGIDAALWLRDRWQGFAVDRPDFSVELIAHSGSPQPSVVATIEGTTFPEEVVVFGGHLDSIAFSSSVAPGADDDASGVATVTEVLRVALATGYRPERTVKFMAYAAEEVGLVGSGDIADEFAASGVDVVGVLQLDMDNYKGSFHDIYIVTDYTNQAQNQFLADVLDAYLPYSVAYTQCGYGCSDHASWTFAGFPASFTFEAAFGQHSPFLHSSADTFANSGGDATHATKFGKMAAAFMAELAKGDFDDGGGGSEPTTETFADTVARRGFKLYGPFPVIPGTEFTAEMTGTGDANLYVRFLTPSGAGTNADCAFVPGSSNESCTNTVPAGHTSVRVFVRGVATTSDYDLSVTYFNTVVPR